MKTVKLPVLPADLSTEFVMDILISHGARGGVVKREASYDFVALEDLVDALGLQKGVTLPEIKTFKLDLDDILRVDDPAWVYVKTSADNRFAAPLYVCPKGDHTQSGPGTCPNDGEPLERVKDT